MLSTFILSAQSYAMEVAGHDGRPRTQSRHLTTSTPVSVMPSTAQREQIFRWESFSSSEDGETSGSLFGATLAEPAQASESHSRMQMKQARWPQMSQSA